MDETILELETLLNRFVDGDNTSLAVANRLELRLSDLFPVMKWLASALAISRTGRAEANLSSMPRKMQARLSRLRSYLALRRW